MSTSSISGTPASTSSTTPLSPRSEGNQFQRSLESFPPQFNELKIFLEAFNTRIEQLEREKCSLKGRVDKLEKREELSRVEISEVIDLPSQPPAKRISSIAIAKDLMFIAREADEPLLVYSFSSQTLNKLSHDSSRKSKNLVRIAELKILTNGLLSIFFIDGTIELRDLKTHKRIFETQLNETLGSPRDKVNVDPSDDCMSVSHGKKSTPPIQVASNRFAFSGIGNRGHEKICFFEPGSDKLWFTPFHLPHSIRCLLSLSNGKVAAALEDGSIQIIDPDFEEKFALRKPIHQEKRDEKKTEQKQLRSPRKQVNPNIRRKILSLHALQNHKQIASLSIDKTIKISNIDDGQVVNVLDGHQATPTCFLEVPSCMISTDKSGKILVWNKADGQPKHKIDGHDGEIRGLLDPYGDGSVVITGSGDKTVKIWDPIEGTCLRSIYVGAPVTTISLDEHGRIIVGAGNKILILVNHARPLKGSSQ